MFSSVLVQIGEDIVLNSNYCFCKNVLKLFTAHSVAQFSLLNRVGTVNKINQPQLKVSGRYVLAIFDTVAYHISEIMFIDKGLRKFECFLLET